jgi:hypothetical protein
MTSPSLFKAVLSKLGDTLRSSIPGYRFIPNQDFKATGVQQPIVEKDEEGFCSTCGKPIVKRNEGGQIAYHNASTCRLVNLALTEMGVSLDQMIRIEVYPDSGPLKGYYSPFDPYTIHVAEEAYSRFPEYIIFHETKHLVDCLTKGWSEEDTPDPFARNLCARYGYGCPPSGPPDQSIMPQFGQQIDLNSRFTC